MARTERAVIVAAGMGRRLQPYTDTMPKALVPLRGRPLLDWQLAAYRAHGLTDVVIVRGYRGEVFEARRDELGPGVRFIENRDYETNNILVSLFHARGEMDRPFLFSYSDIVFAPDVVEALLGAEGDICLVVDRAYADAYEGRTLHPIEEAELCSVGAGGRVTRVGKRAVPPEEAAGEFIGLARFSAAGARAFCRAWDEVSARYRGREEEPFGRAPHFRQAYLTDLLQHLIDGGHALTPVMISGSWREIDTTQDLARAEATVDFG